MVSTLKDFKVCAKERTKMMKPIMKITALALAAGMSLSTFVSAPATALATTFYTCPARSVTSYYDYSDWRINELDRLYTELGNRDYDASTLEKDRQHITNAIKDIEYVQDRYNWGNYYEPYRYGTLRRGGYGYGNYYRGGYYPYDYYYAPAYNWDVYYYDYLDAVDNIVTICYNNLSEDAKTVWNNKINIDTWGYRNWNDYYDYWYGRPYWY